MTVILSSRAMWSAQYCCQKYRIEYRKRLENKAFPRVGGVEKTTDITAFVLVFPPMDEEDKYVVLPYFWVPEDTLDLCVRRDHVPYDVWERQGHLQTTEGNVSPLRLH